ncbi:bifunctional GMP synthase/glutamine amidotransferase protein [Escherichia coli]|uniref:Bifunctional GMP synthase/glutamine amidotransferase protein n=1 Tax=Escherichia coli TaxID=562 RepID=A0A447X217_ECOLX|nr:bifunctional GMP synthase/glutamine amidotransferase protein [Escherichia coli]
MTSTQAALFFPAARKAPPKKTARVAPQYVFEAGVPVFGVCYGMQTMAMQLGGHVEASNEREFGYAQVEVVNDSALVRGIEDALTADGKPLLDVWMSHGDKLPLSRPTSSP